MDPRELLEGIIIIGCGLILLSPVFNTIFYIEYLAFFERIPEEFISHLGMGLVPIILVYLVDMFRFNGTD